MQENKLAAEIGNRIYERRKQIGMTQEKLSELSETTPQAISNYERGERELKAGMIIKVAQALGISTDYLLTGKDNSEKLQNIPEEKKIIIQDIIEKCLELIKN